MKARGTRQKVRVMVKIREKVALSRTGGGEEQLEIYGGLREWIIVMKKYPHGPMDSANKLKVRFRVGDPEQLERRKGYSKCRIKEEAGAQNCPRGEALGSRTQRMAECEL